MRALSADGPAEHDPVTIDGPVPDAAMAAMASLPAVRADRVAQALARIESGAVLTAEELADKVVGRLVCDRLR
jgi:hypothetical protein